MESLSEEKRISDRLVALVDIVFGVVFGLSIPTIFGSNTTLALPNSLAEIVTPSNTALLIAYVAIILSWVGYHKAMEHYPFKIGHGGTMRFFIDLAIVFSYAVVIYARDNLTVYLAIFPLIFFFYFIWDVVLNREYGRRVTSEWISLRYSLVLLVIWAVYYFVGMARLGPWIFLALVLLLNFGFRYEKRTWHPST